MAKRVIDGRYSIVRKLGSGSSGTVYLTHLVGEKQLLALKVLTTETFSQESVRAFRDEFALLSHLDHPFIIKIHSFGLTSKKKPYFVMEYVDGPPCDTSLFATVGLDEFYNLLVDICLALEHIHAYGLVHQDIKPTNILIQRKASGRLQAKLSDFGLATSSGSGGPMRLSGTLEYFAPESIRGSSVDRRADLYSLGVTLYEVLTGQNPFRADDPRLVLKHHLETRPAAPRSLNADIPLALEKIVLRLLEKDPLDRYPTAAAVVEDLRRETGYRFTPEQERAASILPPGEFVGRAAELAHLREWHQEVQAGSTRLVLVEGAHGLGKTRLLKEFAVHCQLGGSAVLGDLSSGKLMPSSEMPSLKKAASSSDYRSWELVCRQISQFSQAPVLIIEDLESGDAAILDFVRYLLQRLRRHALMICLSYQASDLDAARNSRLQALKKGLVGNMVRTLPLRPLRKSSLAQLLRSRFRLAHGEEQLIEYLYQRSGGNPFFAEAYISALKAQGVLKFQAGGWTLQMARIDEIKVPEVLQDVNALILAGMNTRVKSLLAAASVLGESFHQHDLTHLVSLPKREFFQFLGLALRSGWLVRERVIGELETRYRFGMSGLRDLLYQSLATDVRRRMHHKVARQLERQSPKGQGLVALADHHHRAGNYSKSAKYSSLAARQALSSSRPQDAHRLFAQALQARERTERRTHPISDLEGLGDACSLLGKYSQALQQYDRALQLLDRPRSRDRLAIQLKKAIVFRRQSRFDEALDELDRALASAGAKSNRLARARLMAEMGWVQRMKADYPAALVTLGNALKLLKWRQDRADTARVLNSLGVVSWTLGQYQEAQAYYEKALKMYQELGDQDRIAALLDNLGLAHLSQGHTERAVEHFQESLYLRRSTGEVLYEAKACHNLAMAYQESGQWDQAILFYLQSQGIKERIGDLDGLALTLNNLGILYMHQGRWEEAQRCQQEALEIRKKLDDTYGLSGSYDNLGDLARLRGDWKEALQHYQKARRGRTQMKDALGSCYSLLNLGRLELDQHHVDRAEGYLKDSRLCFQKHGDSMGRMQADLALAELSAVRGQMVQARQYAESALNQASRAGSVFAQAQAERILGLTEGLSGERRTANELFQRSVEILKKLPARFELAKTFYFLGLVGQEGHRMREAIRYYRESLLIFQKLEVKRYMSRIEKQLENLQASLDEQESTELFTLYTMSQILNSMRDLDLLLEKVLDLAVELLHAERGAIILYDASRDELQVKIARSMEKETLSDALEISRSTIKSVAREGRPVVVDNALQDKQFSRWQSVTMYNIMSILCVPLRLKGDIIGTIYLDNRTVPGIFSARDVSFLESFANLTAMAIENAKMYTELHGENVYLKGELETRYKYENIVGNSKVMQDIFNIIERVSPSKANVLILGESGTGKELAARLIHYSSPRKDRPFLKVNCAALTESLLESELFGIEERIATGVKSRKGKFELADGGTIFLDEIGDMSLATQAKVLRVLQEREFERVGGSKTIEVDVRILSATNQDLQQAIEEKNFRKDLFYRLNTVAIRIPSLRERKEDIPFLVDYFIEKYCRENEREQVVVSPETMQSFLKYHWPGNVRELENVVQRGVVMAEGRSFPQEVIPTVLEGEGEGMSIHLPASATRLYDVVACVERSLIENALREQGYVQLKAAKALGLSESALRYKMRKYGIKK